MKLLSKKLNAVYHNDWDIPWIINNTNLILTLVR